MQMKICNSNTTLVKVKCTCVYSPYLDKSYSNTTLVKVKLSGGDSNTTTIYRFKYNTC